MSRFDEQLDRDFPVIAERVTPSPTAWEEIQQRIADREPTTETEIIMLTDNTIRTRRWPLVAAAAAVAALAITGIALINRGDDAEVPAEPPTPTIAPGPDSGQDDEQTGDEQTGEQTGDALQPVDPVVPPLPVEGQTIPPGRYSVDTLGVGIEFDVPPSDTPWTVTLDNPLAVAIGTDAGFVGFQRIGSFYDADQAQSPTFTGLGSIPPDDFDGWVDANGIIVEDSADATIDGRAAQFRRVRVPDGYGDGLCPAEVQPCVRLNSVSADLIDENSRDGSELDGPFANAYWFVEIDDFEPLGVWAFAHDGDLDGWLDEIAPIIESIILGEPAPVIEGGTARVPERVAVTANMTVTQTGDRDLDNPWPVEWTGSLDGDIAGTYVGAGMSTPNGAEVTLEWTMDVTIEGLGSGSLTLRSDWVWLGDGAHTATDRVISGTGDFEGVTGFGTSTQTSDFGPGVEYTATIELMLAPPTR